MKNQKLIILGVLVFAIVIAGCISVQQKPTEEKTEVQELPKEVEEQPKVETKACPASCDDGLTYTKDYCSDATNFECKHETVKNICGNQICEVDNKENTFTCAADCQRKACTIDTQCDDKNPCTKDTCTQGFCYNVERIDIPCYYTPFTGESGAGVSVTGLKVQNSSNNSIYAFGEVMNGDIVNFKNIRLKLLIYKWEEDDQGIKRKVLVLNKTGKIFFDDLAPGQKSPFYLYLGTTADYASYTYNISYTKSDETPYKEFAVEVKKCGQAEGYETIVKNAGNLDAYDVVIYYLFRDYPSKEILRVVWEPLPKGKIAAGTSAILDTKNCGGPNYLTHYVYTTTKVS